MRRPVFTARQAEILSLIASGLSDKEIAARLGISYSTVRTHLDRIFQEQGFRCRAEAVVAWLLQMGAGPNHSREFHTAASATHVIGDHRSSSIG